MTPKWQASTGHSLQRLDAGGMDFSSRYKTPLNDVFSRQHKLELEWRVELALLKALGDAGIVPAGAHAEVAAAVAAGRVTLERTLEIEKETHHDIMAVVKALTEAAPEFGEWVHYGATSQDVNDTVTALQLRECRDVLLGATRDVRRELARLADTHAAVPTIGRTHGQHAIPITLGFKFANYLYEMTVAESFLERVGVVAKFSGAVGTFASLGTRGVQESIMAQLGLDAAPISTQVVSRLHYADFVFALAAIAAALERLGKEIRNLQRSEINELSEGFGDKQVRGGRWLAAARTWQ
jgi:adenylosuccinate lyase